MFSRWRNCERVPYKFLRNLLAGRPPSALCSKLLKKIRVRSSGRVRIRISDLWRSFPANQFSDQWFIKFSMRIWLCLFLIKRYNRNSSSSQLLASCSIESSESSSIKETKAALNATAILFSFLNLARDSVDALYNFAPAVMITDPMN